MSTSGKISDFNDANGWGVQARFGGFYNANSAKLMLSEVNREHGQTAADKLIAERELEKIFVFKPATHLEGGVALDKKVV